jgi:hypothetical protein
MLRHPVQSLFLGRFNRSDDLPRHNSDRTRDHHQHDCLHLRTYLKFMGGHLSLNALVDRRHHLSRDLHVPSLHHHA